MRKDLYSMTILASLVLALLTSGAGSAARGAVDGPQAGAPPLVRDATRTDTSASLRRLPPISPAPVVLGQIFERPLKLLPNREGALSSAGLDPALQGPVGSAGAPVTLTSFEGVNNVNSVLPPDTVGDIGPNHYVQMVNLSFAIYDRSGNRLYGPVDNSTLWQGFGGPCETTNDGDPIVLYDHLADRWMMSQFALPNFPRGPFYQCIAVSQTADPMGAWHRYEFLISDTKLNDYPKFGLWSDGYYMTVNQFKCSFIRCSWAGQGAVAFERDRMLVGQPARMVYFDLFALDPNLGGMLPADLDGPLPPPGAPNLLSQIDDDSWGYSPDQLQIWEFHVDWDSPSNSTFARASLLTTAPFDSDLCGYARNCIPQPGGTDVDAISDRLMYRLQYRNFGTHQAMVVNHTVDVDGTDHAGVRWYELRDSGSGWSIYQQGTYAPDSDHRWMGSAAMNGVGDLALGFSVSSASTFPSIRYTGRLAGDPPGGMTVGEGEIVTGSGYQLHSSGRWGDYSMLAVDPLDDCTFWYTQEYYALVDSAPWQTRIGSFKLADCVSQPTPTPTSGATPTPTSPPTSTPTPAPTATPGGTAHVGDLDGTSLWNGKNTWTATVTITIHDADHNPVANASVSGAWSGGASGTASCTTGADGQCSVTSTKINQKKSATVTFTVEGVTHASLSYQPADNHDPDGDSDGTSITITMP